MYDPAKRFRSWLKTLVNHELANIAREAVRQVPGEKGTGSSEIYELLLQHPDGLDDLVEGLHECSIGMLRLLNDAMEAVRAGCQGDQLISWELFRRRFLMDEQIALFCQRIQPQRSGRRDGPRLCASRRSVRAKATQLLRERASGTSGRE